MEITFDPEKRQATLDQRGLDFEDAIRMFAGEVATEPDLRKDYAEARFISAGWLDDRMVVIVWTPRGRARRIISMRYVHAKEAERWQRVLGPR